MIQQIRIFFHALDKFVMQNSCYTLQYVYGFLAPSTAACFKETELAVSRF